MKYIVKLILSFIIIGCSSKSEKLKHHKDLNIYGNVKSLTQNTFDVIENNGEIKIGDKTNGWNYNQFNITFNKRGLITRKIETQQDGVTELLSHFKYDSTDSLIEKSIFDMNNNLLYKIKCEYDNSGNKITETRLSKEDRISYQKIFSYNNTNNLIKEKHFLSNDYLTLEYDENGNSKEVTKHEPISLSYTKTIKYNSVGNKTEEVTKYETNNNWKTKYLYNDNGHLKEEIMYNSDDLIILKWLYKHHENGIISEKSGYQISEDRKILYLSVIYNFDENGRQLSEVIYNSSDEITIKEKRKYNINGDIEENTFYTSDNSMNGIFKYLYEYDNQNNWIKSTELWNEKPNSITERKIEYYN